MVEKTIINIIRRYLHALPAYGIHARQAVLFGSCVRGQNQAWSDIDLVVIAPEFDGRPTVQQVKQLWIATGVTDNRIEPIPCGEKEWETQSGRPILEIARREGLLISPEQDEAPLHPPSRSL
ncbi:MAG: nucleotidyltransferase domain-containing protein [Phycisphaerales bacterium]|nr:nucleotidyltransferase domain-containing protein [Phycisphaerales bacterium]